MKMVALAMALVLVACRSAGSSSPYAPSGAAARNTVRAQELNAEAADAIATDPEAAERLLREALGADLFFGPAHNNLGVVYLKQGKLYEAASEFEWARKLMPGHPDPRMNLALTLEQAGKIDEAIATYRTALEVWPGHIATLQALAKMHVVGRMETPELEGWLGEIGFFRRRWLPGLRPRRRLRGPPGRPLAPCRLGGIGSAAPRRGARP